MKRVLYLLLFALGFSPTAFSQLTGTKTIPGDYATIASAITDLNANGVGTGGVTFNIAAGYTETFTSATAGTITATGTVANPIVFQKSGTGANPVITAATPGTGVLDGIIKFSGSDYITFDGINLQENSANTTSTAQMEWGYAVLKASATDGAQNITIRNCSISLNKANTSSVAIYSANHLTTSTSSLTVTAASGANSNNKFYNNTIGNTYIGIGVYGYNDATSPYALYDQNNEIGFGGANNITNYGGGSSTAYGIYTIYQNGIKVANNVINGGTGTTTTLYGIFLSSGTNSNVDISWNTVTIAGGGTTSTIYGINNAMGSTGTSNTVNINNNTVQNCTYTTATTGVFYGIYNTASATTVNMYGNTVTGCTLPGTGSFYGVHGGSGTTLNMYNNTVSSNQKTGASGTMYLTYASNTTVSYHDNVVMNNSIPSTSGTSGGTIYCYYDAGSPTSETYYLNSIHDNSIGGTTTGSCTIYGMYTNTSSSSVKSYYDNSIYNLSVTQSGTQTIYGIYNSLALTVNIYRNNINNFTATNAGATINGIYLSSGTTAYIYNNYISDLKTPAATGTNAINGIYISGGTTVGVFYNTVFLNATSSSASTFGTSGIYASTTPTVELRNNNIVNISTPVGTAYTVAYRRSSTTLTTYAANSNNNNFYAGTPGANRLIYYDGTNADQTLSAFKGRVAPRDASSVTENPPFVNNTTAPYNLHLQSSVPTQCESGGSVISTPAIITDYDNNPRYPNPGYPNNLSSPATAPDIGADEFAGLFLDLNPPSISLTPFLNTSSTAPRVLTATITDGTGVPTSGIGLPVLYWRINTGSWNSATAVSIGSNQYTFTFGGGAVLNDIVSYYIVAQDTYTPANIGCSPATGAGGFTANPPAAATPPTTPFSYQIVGTLSGVYPVGVGQVYPTITAAIADLNLKECIGPVTFELWDANYSTSETFPLIIYKSAGVSAANPVTFKPKAGVTSTITGSSTTGILVLYGCNYITFDGSNSGGTSRNLTLENSNTSTNTYVVGVFNNGISGAQNCTLKNSIVKAGTNATSGIYGIILNYLGGGYANTTIQNNQILRAYTGMQFVGVSTGITTGGTITQNEFGSTTDAESLGNVGLLLTYLDGLVISQNSFTNIKVGSNPKGIVVSTSTLNTTINRNNLTGIRYTGTGGYGGKGIDINTGSLTSNLVISNNTISQVLGDGWSTFSSDAIVGIRLLGTTGGVTIDFNSINLTGTLDRASATADKSAAIYLASTVASVDIRDNILVNSLENTTGVATAYTVYSDAPNTAFTAINYNDYYVSGPEGILAYLGADRTTLAAWQTATGQDANSQNINPLFTSATDLHPTQTTLNNLGVTIAGFPVDFTGALRTSPPDMGAYEFGLDPVITTDPATSVAQATATLNGTINANNSTVNSFFDYGLTTAYGSSISGAPASVTGSTTTPISGGVIGLLPNTTYHFRARGVTTGGLTIFGPDLTFTTMALPPAVVTTAATGVTTGGATLNGTVNANGASTTVTFQWGLTAAYGNSVSATPGTITGSTTTPVSAPITGLLPNTTYHFRVVGVNSGGTSTGNDMTFTTAPVPPTVVTDPASNIGTNSATLNGTVTANYASTTVTFEWGLTTSYGNVAPGTPGTVTGATPTAVLANIAGLISGMTYHYRCVGVNAAGTTYGSDVVFQAGCPPVGPAGAITGPTSVCSNSSGKVYSIAPITNATGYNWTVPTGAIITAGANTTSITVTFGSTSGDVSVYGTSACGNGAPSNLAVVVYPLPVPTITGPASPCAGSTGNVYTTQTGMTGYTWTVSAGGTITAGAGTSSVTVTWNTAGAQTVGVTYTNSNGCAAAAPASYAVTVQPAPTPTITGPTSMCVNSGYYNYSTQSGMSNYVWNISSGGTITYGQGTSQIQVTWNQPGAQWVSVNYTSGNGCPAAVPTTYNVTVDPLPAAAGNITGSASVCGGAMGVAYSVAPIADATSYVWTLPVGATIASGGGTNSITVDFAANASSGNITVMGNNVCGNGASSAPFAVTVTPLPSAAGQITGQAQVCQGTTGVTYSVDPIANATGYTWTVPAGATIASGSNTNTITVDFSSTASSGAITVYGTNTCGNGAASPAFNVTLNPIPPTPVITQSGYDLISSASTGNQWYLDGNAIPGATGQTYTVTASGTYYVIVTLNGCSSEPSNSIAVVIPGLGENNGAASFIIFPNPNDGKFNLQLSGIQPGTYSIEVINNLGMKVKSLGNIAINNKYVTEIDLRPVPAGIYTVILRSATGQEVRKVLVR